MRERPIGYLSVEDFRTKKQSNILFWITCLFTIIFFSNLSAQAEAPPSMQYLSYNGRLLKPDGKPLISNSVLIKVQIKSAPPSSCILFEDIQEKDLSYTAGVFSIKIKEDSLTRTDTTGLTMGQIFSNKTMTSTQSIECANGSTNNPPPLTEGRKFYVYFKDNTDYNFTDYDPLPAQDIQYVPMALESLQVGGYSKERLLRIADGVDSTNTELDATKLSDLLAIINGTTDKYLKMSDANNFNGANIKSSSISDSSVVSLNYSKLTSVPEPLREIASTTCSDGEILKKTNGVWTCTPDAGTVQAFAKAAPGSGLKIDENILKINISEIQSAASGQWGIDITGNANTSTSFTGNLVGDVSGTQSQTIVDKINGVNVSKALATDDGKYLRFLNGMGWQPQFMKLSDLKNSLGTSSAFNVDTCNSSQTLIWSSITDQFSCQNISLPADQVTGLSTAATSGSYSDLINKPNLGTLAAKSSLADEDIAAAAAISWSKINKTGAAAADIGASPTAGSTNLTILGTITTGTWNGNKIEVANGGTGSTSLASNSVILGNGTSAVQTVAPGASGNVLTSDGTTWKSQPSTGVWAVSGSNVSYTAGSVGVGTASPTSSLQVSGSFAAGLNTVTTTQTLTASQTNILANVSSGSITLTLPTAVGISGREYRIKKIDNSVNTVTIATTSSQKIDDYTGAVLSTKYQYLNLVSDGANWMILAKTGSIVPQLYPFNAFTFTTCGATGYTGPNLGTCQSAYSSQSWASNTSYLNMSSQGIQKWTVPKTGTYRIVAAGAAGGTLNYNGGSGAVMAGDFSLTQGTVLQILVGQKGQADTSPHYNENGGGGGTYVINGATGTNALIVAGGGGGAPSASYGTSTYRDASFGDGVTTTNSQGYYSGAGNVSGASGGAGGNVIGSNTGGAGGGLTGNGNNGGGHCDTARGGTSFSNGGNGGYISSCYGGNHNGGFGGGGPGALGNPGAGGGYSGGSINGSWSSYSTWGGGGSSYNTGSNQTNVGGSNPNDGYVTITFLVDP